MFSSHGGHLTNVSSWKNTLIKLLHQVLFCFGNYCFTRDVFYVRREVDLMKAAKVNAYIMHISGKIELLSIHAA